MARLTDGAWDEVALPILDGEEFASTKKVAKPRSDTSETVKYNKHRVAKRANCDDCTSDVAGKKRSAISLASYIRIGPAGPIYLCYFHTNERKHRDQLDGLI